MGSVLLIFGFLFAGWIGSFAFRAVDNFRKKLSEEKEASL